MGKNLGHYEMGLAKSQPLLCWLKCEKTYIHNSRLREGSFCTAHPARGRNYINVEKDQPVTIPCKSCKYSAEATGGKKDESLVCQAGILHCGE